MSNLVIVAIPDENDRVWKISSEKIPHLTLLFLGDVDQVANSEQIVQFVEHAANQTLRRFYLPVDRRGELGDDPDLGPADVLFFKKGRYDYKAIRDFRVTLLKDDNIRTAYDSATQFEGPWQPHLTLGYEKRPAKPDDTDRDFGFYDVSFNKIAVWMGDFDGPDFLLKDYWDEWEALESVPMDVAMSDIRHYGVKGMRWGQRKADLGSAAKAVGGAAKAVGKAAAKGADNTLFEVSKYSPETHREVVDKASTKLVKSLPAIKAKHGDYGKLKNRAKKPFSKEARAYRKDVKDSYVRHLETSANEITNISGSRRYTLKERGKPNTSKYFWDVSTEKNPAKHAFSDTGIVTVQPIFDGEGWIVDIKPVEDAMAQTADLGASLVGAMLEGDESVLEHYGVKGMQWGRRREAPSAVAPSATSKIPHGDKRKTKIEVAGGENHPAHEDAIKVAQARAKLGKSGPAALSNGELRDVANRLQLEQQVKQLTTGGGKKFVTGLLRSEGQQGSQQLLRKGVKKGGRGARKVALGF